MKSHELANRLSKVQEALKGNQEELLQINEEISKEIEANDIAIKNLQEDNTELRGLRSTVNATVKAIKSLLK